ncbi:MAG: cytochrome c [Acidobacteriota bacterium]|nr:cytochrome c [Acidobacteriota bacterium]
MLWKTPLAVAVALGLVVAGWPYLRPEPVSSHGRITTNIMFNREVSQIFQKKCFQCHTEGNVSMSLTTYRDARPWAVAIKEEILEKQMPPWSAVTGYGHFSNDVSLTAREISLIISWADGGAPSGVLLVDEDKPAVIIPSLTGWEHGQPDAVIAVAAGEKVAAGSGDRVARLEVPTGLKAASWLKSLQLNFTDRRVVRYAAVYELRTGQWLGTWTPTHPVSALPADVAIPLPAGGKVAIEIGYRGTDEDAIGAGELGLYFSDSKPAQVAVPLEISAKPVSVAAGQASERVRTEFTIKSATNAAALWPRLGVGATSVEVTAIRPDGVVEPLLWLKDYRADWPSSYVFRQPVALPAGTRLAVTAYYGNTGDAPMRAQPALSVSAFPLSRPASSPAP